MHSLILSTGSNLGDRKKHLEAARILIRERVGRISLASSLYESEPWGYGSENPFYNQCLLVETDLDPEPCMGKLLGIEEEIGRLRKKAGFEDRLIDIDILFYDELVMDSDRLKIPHPGLAVRKFVLLPLNEILPDLIHPGNQKTVCGLLQECRDTSRVEKVPGTAGQG